jgi:hypothetical protein
LGQAKTAYGLNRIRARLQNTSESWIASIILVLNLVKLAGVALHCIIGKWLASFSARRLLEFLIVFQQDILGEPESALEFAYYIRTNKTKKV